MKNFSLLRILALFTTTLFFLCAVLALHTSQKPIPKTALIDASNGNTDAATNLLNLQTILSNRMGLHRTLMSTQLTSLHTSLSEISNSIDDSLLDVEDFKLFLRKGAVNELVLKILESLVISLNRLDESRMEDSFEQILESVEVMRIELDDMDIFLSELQEKIASIASSPLISDGVESKAEQTVVESHVFVKKISNANNGLNSLQEAMLVAFMNRAANPSSPSYIDLSLLPPRPFLNTLRTNIKTSLTAKLSTIGSSLLPENVASAEANSFICLSEIHISCPYVSAAMEGNFVVGTEMECQTSAEDVVVENNWAEEKWIDENGVSMGTFGDSGLEEMVQWWE